MLEVYLRLLTYRINSIWDEPSLTKMNHRFVWAVLLVLLKVSQADIVRSIAIGEYRSLLTMVLGQWAGKLINYIVYWLISA